MIQIDDKLISEDIFAESFVCNLTKCKGACCVDGDTGAPLEKEELAILDDIFPKVKPYLRPEGVKAIEEQGTWVIDDYDGGYVTTLVNGSECAYVIFDEKGTYSFWMKDMNFPLDLIYIDETYYIVDIIENKQPCTQEECNSFVPSAPFKYVLEVKGGFCDINRVDIGNAVIFDI